MVKKLVLFGAGNIGRSFIGQLFSRGGFQVVFVDINEHLVRDINREHRYRVLVKHNDNRRETIWVENVRAVYAGDSERVAAEIVDTPLVATAAGKAALPHIFPTIAEGLKRRLENYNTAPVDIIIAENTYDAAEYFRSSLTGLLPAAFDLDSVVGLVETSIGKMVPIMTEEDMREDPLWVFAERYNTLIVDRNAFKNPIPDIPGMCPKTNMRAFVDRKRYIHNLGHAAAAYFGYLHNPDATYLHEVVKIPQVYERTREAMMESAWSLAEEYPRDLPIDDLEEHVDGLLKRFRNMWLGDTVYRVGKDLLRKLHKSDRLLGAMLLARKHDKPFGAIADALLAGFEFRAPDSNGQLYPGDHRFSEHEFPKGAEHILIHVCGLSWEDPDESEALRVCLNREERGCVAKVKDAVAKGG